MRRFIWLVNSCLMAMMMMSMKSSLAAFLLHFHVSRLCSAFVLYIYLSRFGGELVIRMAD